MSCGTRTQQTVRAILTAPNSSVPSLNAGTAPLRTAGDVTCSVACHSATLRQPAPSPVLRLLWLGTPLPNLPARAPAADAFTEVLLSYCAAGSCVLHFRIPLLRALRSCSWRPLTTAGHPVRPSVPSPSSKNPGSGTPQPHRTANYALPPAVHLCRACSISATEETVPTPPSNVYSGQHRFSCLQRWANHPRTTRGTDEGPTIAAEAADTAIL